MSVGFHRETRCAKKKLGRPRPEALPARDELYTNVAMLRIRHRIGEFELARRYRVAPRTIRRWVARALTLDTERADFLRDYESKKGRR